MHNRGFLLDRDGVINVDHGYVSSPNKFQFMDGLFPFLRRMQDNGFRLAIITNQSGVARGYYSEEDFWNLTRWMNKQLLAQGIVIEQVFACFEYAEGNTKPYNRESYWRKPSPGMVLDAVQRMRLDPARSIFLGDKRGDMQAAQAGKIGRSLWLTNNPEDRMEGVLSVRNFDEAIKALGL